MDIGDFWTIVAFAFVFGVLGLVAFVFYFWFVVVPHQVLGEERSARSAPTQTAQVEARRSRRTTVTSDSPLTRR